MLCTLHLVDRSHTTSAYSTIGLHRLAYASSLASWGALCMRCLIPPSIYFAKAFDDKVLHQLLMKQCCEVVPNITIIISHHQPTVNDVHAQFSQTFSELHVPSGIPQGSVHGLTLFLAYVSNLPNCADDTLIYQVGNNTQRMGNFQSENLDVYMAFSVDKVSVLVFNPQQSFPG